MKYVLFELAGKVVPHSQVFLTSNSRKYRYGTTIFHRNDWHTIIEIPKKVFKKFFKYENWTGIYKTNLTYDQLICEGGKITTINLEE